MSRKQPLIVIILATFAFHGSYGHSYNVVCSSTMKLCGHSRLGRATTAGSGTVKLTRAGTALACGSSLNSGETLGLTTASLVGELFRAPTSHAYTSEINTKFSGGAVEILIEVLGAASMTGGSVECQTRSLDASARLVAPSSGTVTAQVPVLL